MGGVAEAPCALGWGAWAEGGAVLVLQGPVRVRAAGGCGVLLLLVARVGAHGSRGPLMGQGVRVGREPGGHGRPRVAAIGIGVRVGVRVRVGMGCWHGARGLLGWAAAHPHRPCNSRGGAAVASKRGSEEHTAAGGCQLVVLLLLLQLVLWVAVAVLVGVAVWCCWFGGGRGCPLAG